MSQQDARHALGYQACAGCSTLESMGRCPLLTVTINTNADPDDITTSFDPIILDAEVGPRLVGTAEHGGGSTGCSAVDSATVVGADDGSNGQLTPVRIIAHARQIQQKVTDYTNRSAA